MWVTIVKVCGSTLVRVPALHPVPNKALFAQAVVGPSIVDAGGKLTTHTRVALTALDIWSQETKMRRGIQKADYKIGIGVKNINKLLYICRISTGRTRTSKRDIMEHAQGIFFKNLIHFTTS